MGRPLRTAVNVLAILVAVGLSNCHSASNPILPTCQYAVSPAAINAPAGGGQSAVTITTTSTCSWTAVPDREWISVSSGSGTGSASVAVTIAANTGTSARTGTLAIGGMTVTIAQAGQPACELAVSPDQLSIGPAEATGTIAVSTQDYCPWTASGTAAWIHVTGGQAGQGNGTITYLAERNTTAIGRSGQILVNQRVVSISQEGDIGVCTYAVTPVEFNPCLTPLSLNASLATQEACPWTVSPTASWISLATAGAGTGSASISMSIAPNYDAPRHGVVEVRWPTPTAGQNLHVYQAGCLYGVSTSALAIGSSGGTLQFDVYQQTDPVGCGGPLQDACLWTAVSTTSWLTVATAMPVRGDGRVTLSVAPNAGGVRVATVTVKDRTVVVTQGGSLPSARPFRR